MLVSAGSNTRICQDLPPSVLHELSIVEQNISSASLTRTVCVG